MTMDKSLRVRAGMIRARSVLRRAERITRLQESDRWTDASSPLGLPKVRVYKLAMKKKKITALTVANKLAKKSLNNAGLTALDSFLAGPSTLVWGSEDIVALSKEMSKWAKEIEPLQIKGGTTEGTALDAAKIESLMKI